MADHNKPVLTSTYANFVSELDARFDDLSLGLDPAVTTATNLPVNSLRWNSALGKDQKWNGTVWGDKSAFYALGSVRFNNGTATAPSITFGDDTTTGISKPTASTVAISTAGTQRASFSSAGLSLANSLSFTGTGNRITGDFSNATPVNRVMFQSSVSNGTTNIGIVPNGTSTTSQIEVYSSSNLVNSSLGQVVASSTDVRLVSGIIGTGTYLPLRFFTSGIQRMQIDTSGNSSFQGEVSSTSLSTSGNLSFTGTSNRITGDFSNATLGSRLFFQTSTVNGASEVSAIPNGTGNGSGFKAYSLLDVQNSPSASIQSTSTEVIVEADRTGTASYLPMVIRTGGAEAFRVNTNQTVSGLEVTEINTGQVAGLRNKITNGKMEIAQRGTSFAAVTGAYTLDRFVVTNASNGVVTASQQLDAPAGGEFQSSLRVAVTTADATIDATQVGRITQRIEGYDVRDLQGRTFTLSFRVRSSKTGVHCIAFGNSGADRSYVLEYTVNAANTWETKSVTVNAGLITAGTWNWTTGVGLSVDFTYACGSNFRTTAGTWATGQFFGTVNQVNCLDTIGNIFAITGVQLEVGPVATPFEHRPFGTELTLCQRYYTFSRVYVPDAGSLPTNWFFKVTMRATPTIAGGGAGYTTFGTTVDVVSHRQTSAGAQDLTATSDL